MRHFALFLLLAAPLLAQNKPYDVFPPADPPYYRVRYEAGAAGAPVWTPARFTA